jgi:outer membrane protein OmpA-like peptidoglycan-associated protein
MMKSFYSLATVLLLTVVSLTAQNNAKVERANRYMKELNYVGAIELLNQVLAKGDNAAAKIALAECYRKVNDTENGEFLYGQVVRLPEAQPIHYLYYGEMLQRNNKCDLAREWFTKFAEALPEDARGQFQNKACDYEADLKVKGDGIYNVNRTKFNSNLDDFGATFYKDGIVFASERDKGGAVKRNHCWTGQPFLDLYFVPIKNCGAEATNGRPEKFNSDINSKYHDAVVTFTKDQNTIFFTRNNYANGKTGRDDEGIMRLKIYTAKQKGKDGWSDEESLPFNSDEYSSAHPTINADGTKLYFSSDMPGGFGGMDLYVSELENGRWGPPMNLGPNINTEGNELFPFIHKSGRLYYASDGQLGLGGLDIYYIDSKGEGTWSNPENIGAPVNSKDDDFGFVLSDEGTCGFFSSDRQGGSGRDDIYSFTKTAAPVKVFVFDEKTKEPIVGAVVTSEQCKRKELKTGKDGTVVVDVKFNSCCDFKAEFADYEPSTKEGCVKDAASMEDVIVEIPLKKVEKFMVDGFVFDQSTGLPLADAKVTLMDCDTTKEDQTFTTDASGKFNFKLDTGCCYKLRGEKDKFFAITTGDTICTKGIVGSKSYSVNLNLQPTTTTTPSGTDVAGGKDPSGSNPTAGGGTNVDKPGSTTEGGIPITKNAIPTFNKGDKIPKNTVYIDGATGKVMKNGKPFTGTHDGIKYKNGLPVSEPTTVPQDVVYLDQKDGLYKKGGKPYTGTKDGITYKGGKMTDTGKSTTFPGTINSYPESPDAVSYLLHIYYDFDQSFIRDESDPELNKLLKLIQDNPNYIIEISSHTDARGSNNYNNRLSQRRAEAVVKWLVGKGVSRDQLVPRGYGEGMTTNNCKNNVQCTEEEHQMNRRTEFRVLGCKNCVEEGKAKLSQPKTNPRVDKCNGCPF